MQKFKKRTGIKFFFKMLGTLNQGKIRQGEGKRSKKDKNPREKGNILGKYRENKAGRGVAGIRGKRETFQVNIE